MSDASGNWGLDGVRLLRQDRLDPAIATSLAGHQVAVLTHLPGDVPDDSRSALSLPPGAPGVDHAARADEQLYFVIRGKASLQWGRNLEYSGTAGPGSVVIVPPGVRLRETNGSGRDPLERLLVTNG